MTFHFFFKMSSCELCGAPEAQITAQVEGVQLKVCRNCQKHGSIKLDSSSNYGYNISSPKPIKQERPEQKLVFNFAQLLCEARKKRNLNNEDFAKLLQEKESTVAKWESGSMCPPIPVAVKIGQILNIHFIEKDENIKDQTKKAEKLDSNRSQPDELTLGDFIKVHQR